PNARLDSDEDYVYQLIAETMNNVIQDQGILFVDMESNSSESESSDDDADFDFGNVADFFKSVTFDLDLEEAEEDTEEAEKEL
ncbi:hypothetical protein A2U01_0086710, partial [Trifolium medium]|nr:hypothetical protein [Trifolium medium]